MSLFGNTSTPSNLFGGGAKPAGTTSLFGGSATTGTHLCLCVLLETVFPT